MIMKNIYLFVITILLAAMSYGQNYNLGFENWSGTTTFTNLSASSTGLNCHPYLMQNAETVFMAGSVSDNQIIDAWSARVHGIMRCLQWNICSYHYYVVSLLKGDNGFWKYRKYIFRNTESKVE